LGFERHKKVDQWDGQLISCQLNISSVSLCNISPCTTLLLQVLLADALYGKKEYRRALNMYRQALQQCRVSPKQAMGGTRTPVQSRLPAVNLTHFSNINENEVKYKIGLCHLAVHDTRSALSEVLL
jgi:anaphase-promoting complex subunit 7